MGGARPNSSKIALLALRETGPECSSAATTVAATAAVAAAATKAGCITDVGSDRMGCQGSGGAGGGGSKGRDASSCVGGGDGCEAGLRSRLAAAEARAARAEACAAGTEARLEEAVAQLRWLEKQLDDASGSGPSPPPHTSAIASCAHLPFRREISRRRQLRPNQRPSALSWRRSGRDCPLRLRRSRRRPTESSIATRPRLLRSNACPRHPSGRPRRRRRSTLHRRRGSLSIRRRMIMRRRQRQQ